MTGGKSPIGYLKAYLTNLYLSSDSEKVQEAIEAGKVHSLSCLSTLHFKQEKPSAGVWKNQCMLVNVLFLFAAQWPERSLWSHVLYSLKWSFLYGLLSGHMLFFSGSFHKTFIHSIHEYTTCASYFISASHLHMASRGTCFLLHLCKWKPCSAFKVKLLIHVWNTYTFSVLPAKGFVILASNYCSWR